MDWNVIKTEYITTNISYRKLAAKYGVPFDTLKRRAGDEKWVELRTQHGNKVTTKMMEKAENNAVKYKSMLYELAYKIARQIGEMTDRNSIEELALNGLKPRDITGAIRDIEDVLHIKSEVDLKEQEARIEKLRRDVENGQKTGDEIKIVISGSAEEYSK